MRARRRFAQHFLQPPWIGRLVAALELAPGDALLEIGPGRGALTLALAPLVSHLTGIEIDWDLAADLSARTPPHVDILAGDILDIDLAALRRRALGGPQAAAPVLGPDASPAEPDGGSALQQWRVVGNLPYNITSPILFRLLALHRDHGAVADATLMMQKEVAERLTARPGTGDYGVLGILVALDADVRPLFTLPPSAFRPAPKVQSAVVQLRFRAPTVSLADRPTFERLVRQIFTQRRKTLLNALKPFAIGRAVTAGEAIARAGLDPQARPETLQLAQLALLADVFCDASRAPML